MAGYSDPQSTHNPTTGNAIPASWGDIVRDDIEWLAGGSSNPKPSCKVYNSAAQSIANNTNTALTFNSEYWDNGGMHSTAVNTSRITIPASSGGKYWIGGNAEFVANATGTRWIGLQLNGSSFIARKQIPSNSGSYDTGLFVATMQSLSAGDYVELIVYQNSGGALNVTNATVAQHFWAMWMSV